MISTFLAVALAVSSLARSWTQAVPVNIAGSHVDITIVTSDWTSDQMFLSGRIQQGPIHYNDCLSFETQGDVQVTHIQFMFAAVSTEGEIKEKPLPVDVRIKVGETHPARGACRTWGYANGAKGLWLVAWPATVDFADGTTWHAPEGAELTKEILDALPKDPATEGGLQPRSHGLAN